VRIEGVSLHDLHPPQEVVKAYHDVTEAMEKRDQRINEAQADQIARRLEQKARSQEIVRRAEAAAFEKVRLAQARKEEFAQRSRVRNELSWPDWLKLAEETNARLEAGESMEEAQKAYRRRRDEILDRQAALMDFRLYWDSLTATLTGRPKVLIDTDGVPTRRWLWPGPSEPAPLPPPPRGKREEKGEP
jgi:hypothetical protein